MNDGTSIALMAFTVYAMSSIRRMDDMPAVIRVDGADFGFRIPIRAGRRRFYMPNPFRPDACLVERPRTVVEVGELRALANDLAPFQISSVLCASTVCLGIPVMASSMSLLHVLLVVFVSSASIVLAAFLASRMLGGVTLGRAATSRLIAAAIISPPVAGNLARDVARMRQCR